MERPPYHSLRLNGGSVGSRTLTPVGMTGVPNQRRDHPDRRLQDGSPGGIRTRTAAFLRGVPPTLLALGLRDHEVLTGGVEPPRGFRPQGSQPCAYTIPPRQGDAGLGGEI